MTRMQARGIVYLVGAGPGDTGLLTLRGAELLRSADVVIYDGLVNPALLALAPPEAERIYAGKKHAPSGMPLTQSDINRLLRARAEAGQRVVRLKGGDSFVFGRGAEECRVLAEAGVPFEVVPGVTAATAVCAYAGIPLTARSLASTVAFATGHEAAGKPSSAVDWEALARAGTVVLFMALRTIADCCRRLIDAGRSPDTPAAAIYWGTTASQHTVTSTLRDLPRATADLRPPVLVVVGEVVALRETLAWHEKRPLHGCRVLIPRSRERASAFADEVRSLGGEPVVMPVTRIAAVADASPIDRALNGLAQYDWLLFTSRHAVERFFAELAERGRDARALAPTTRLACVGAATARALAEHRLLADLLPERRDGRGLAEAILGATLPDMSADMSGRSPGGPLRALFPRAEKGRDEAVAALRAAGVEVDVVAVYRTEATPPGDPMLAYGLARLRTGAIDVLAFFAPSQVEALCALLGDDASAVIDRCRVVASIGRTTKAALERRGIAVQVVASSPDASSLARDIALYYQGIGHGTGPAVSKEH